MKKIGPYDNSFNPYLYSLVKNNSKCLDIGCWTGNMGSKLISEKNCTVDGLDINSEALRIAKERGYNNIYEGNLNINPKLLENINIKYDYIICDNVLEHLVDPGLILNLLKDKLSPNGSVLVCVPNVAFIETRVRLLLGDFTYKEAGILDKTHLKFYTMKTLKDLILSSGYNIEIFKGISIVRNRYFFLKILDKIFPSLFAFQFLIEAKIK